MFGGKLVDRLFGQVVRLVDTVVTFFRRRQDHAAAHGHVGQHQVVIGHHHVHVFQHVARQVERTFRPVGTGGLQAAVAVVGDAGPQTVVYHAVPGVAVAVPAAVVEGVGQLAQGFDFAGLRLAVPQRQRRVQVQKLALGVFSG